MVIFNGMCMYEEYVIHIACSKKVNARAKSQSKSKSKSRRGWGIGVFFDESSLVLMDGNVHVSRAQSVNRRSSQI